MDRIVQPETSSSSQIDWVRLPLQRRRPGVVVYALPDVIDAIRNTLYLEGGNDVIQLFRSGCFGYFLDYTGGEVQKRVVHALTTFEVRVSDPALRGREAWFHFHRSDLHFGPSEYNLVTGLRFGALTFDPNAKHVVPPRSLFHRIFQGRRTTVREM